MKKSIISIISILLFGLLSIQAQQDTTLFKLTKVKELKHTSVKNQSSTSTCWCFSGTSFLESELLREGKGEYDLSEMFTVYNAYLGKANRYVRLKGEKQATFMEGGAFNDVIDMIRKNGIVPNEVYTGLQYGSEKHNHSEIHKVLTTYLDAISNERYFDKESKTFKERQVVSPMYKKGLEALLATWLGNKPQEFTYKGKKYSPQSFAKDLDLNLDDYILLSSFNHVPFYEPFVIEVPDNWSQGKAYNLPVDEMAKVISYAVEEGYTVGWASDMGDKYTAANDSVWMIPEKDISDLKREEKKKLFYVNAVPQKKITQEFRQAGYDTFNTTDDHGMHIVGYFKDELGQKFYYVKNSWGTKKNWSGYNYVSEAFVLYKTTTLLVNKNSIPKDIRKKLGV